MAKISQWFKWVGAAIVAVVLALWHFGTKRRTRKLVEAEVEHDKAVVKHTGAIDDIKAKEKRNDAESLKEDALAWAERKKQGW
jgi:hypothetical protein